MSSLQQMAYDDEKRRSLMTDEQLYDEAKDWADEVWAAKRKGVY